MITSLHLSLSNPIVFLILSWRCSECLNYAGIIFYVTSWSPMSELFHCVCEINRDDIFIALSVHYTWGFFNYTVVESHVSVVNVSFRIIVTDIHVDLGLLSAI